ncbi:hypothetical protein BDFB_000360 [Asbolus verrucosus]|uniref:Uncharacterized protein n=1 Tax=Asbolus verrucosus TaxID=1661398 RepID=A0A482W7X7_ASBVE|nr:hypothetical protein BDFB_000360 [Asbolus verrucosus]
MACCIGSGGNPPIITELKELVNQIGDCCCDKVPCSPCTAPCCSPCCSFPFAQVTMTVPPPILAPVRPAPVKPLQLPCPFPSPEPAAGPQQRDIPGNRFDNFYNNYNEDYRSHNSGCGSEPPCPPKKKCEDYRKQNNDDHCPDPGCPTGFKPCTMKLTPPPCCDPYLPWCAQVQPCPPKPKKKNKLEFGPCTRPCCKHWKPKDGPCLYDDPCKAHCFNHPPGMKPSGRFP